MPEADVKLPNGTVVSIKGSPEEIAKIMGLYNQSSPTAEFQQGKKKTKKQSSGVKRSTKKDGPVGMILDLKAEGFFTQKKTAAEVQNKLEEKGHIYTFSAIAVPLLRLVRKRELGRIQEKDGWVYVNR